MSLTIVSSPRFGGHLTPPGHPESPDRAAILEGVAERARDRGVQIVEPRAASDEELRRVHTAAHVAAIERTRGQATMLDPDTFTSPESAELARLAAGAALVGVELCVDPGHAVRGGDSPRFRREGGQSPIPPGGGDSPRFRREGGTVPNPWRGRGDHNAWWCWFGRRGIMPSRAGRWGSASTTTSPWRRRTRGRWGSHASPSSTSTCTMGTARRRSSTRIPTSCSCPSTSIRTIPALVEPPRQGPARGRATP